MPVLTPDRLGSNVIGMFDIDVQHAGGPLKQPLGAISNLLKGTALLPKQIPKSVGDMGSPPVFILVRGVAVRFVSDLLKVLNEFDALRVDVELDGSGGALQSGIRQGDPVTHARVALWNLIMQRARTVHREIFTNDVIVRCAGCVQIVAGSIAIHRDSAGM